MQIIALTLYTSNIKAQKEFYCNTLNISLRSDTEGHIEFVIGNSVLTFKHKSDSKPYHIAINGSVALNLSISNILSFEKTKVVLCINTTDTLIL